MRKAIILVLIFSLGLGVLFWKYSASFFKTTEEEPKIVNLTYWGLREEDTSIRPVIQEYERTHPNTKITYVKQSTLNYRTRVQTQIREGQGPDIFEIHESWVPMFLESLSAAPESVLTIPEFTQTYYPVVKESVTFKNKIYALPLEIDGLALYYNEEILKGVGASVPKTWEEFQNTARKVTVLNQQGQIQTAGAAIGATANIDYWPEILALLFFQQPGSNLHTPNTKEGADVLTFYTSFIIDPSRKTWDVNLPTSTKMFTDGKLAFYFAPANKAQYIKETSPQLPFKTAPVPQLPGRSVALGSFWVDGVSNKSPNQKEAWEFLKYLSSPETLQFLYQQQTQTKLFGRPFPRVDMANLLISDPLRGAFIAQAPYYKAWYLNSNTQDAGINEEMIGLYSQAVEGVLQGKDAQTSLQSITPGIGQIIAKYTQQPIEPIKK